MFPDELLGILVVAIVIALAIAIMYLLSLQNLLKEINQSNRVVEPGNVWIMLIPFVSIVYGFFLYPKISESLRNEYEAREMTEPGDYLKSLGITIPILGVAGLIPGTIIPQGVSTLIGLASLIILIIYWIKVSEFKKKLQRAPKSSGGISSNPDLLD